MEKRVCRGLVAGLTLLLAACAHKGAPQGGPEDTVAPSVAWTSPAAGSLFVPAGSSFRVRFSKWINPQNADKSVFISPSVPRMKISVSGRTLAITPEGRLLDSATYVVTLGTDLADFNGNKLPAARTFAFSTGGRLDSCGLSGLVMTQEGRKLPSVTVGAYLLEDTIPPDPVKTVPLYLTQSAENGAYAFSGLKTGRYRLFAWSDANRNRLFNPGREMLAIAHADLFLSAQNPLMEGIVLIPFSRDTGALHMKKAAALPAGRLNVFFSKALNGAADPAAHLRAFSADSAAAETLQILSAFRDPRDSLCLHLALSKVAHGRKYRVEVRGVTAADDSPLDTARRGLAFLGNGRPDSTAAEVAACLPQKNAQQVDPGDSVALFFSEPVREKEAREGFGLFRITVKSDTADSAVRFDTSYLAVNGKGSFPSPLELVFRPDSLGYGEAFEWRLDPRKCVDAAGNYSPDSQISGRFFTLKEPGSGVLSGRVCGENAGRTRLLLVTVPGVRKAEIAPGKDGRFSLSGLAAGSYRLLSYEDMNGSGRWDRGTLSPFRFSEPFAVISDSVYVRERWEAEVTQTPCGAGKESP